MGAGKGRGWGEGGKGAGGKRERSGRREVEEEERMKERKGKGKSRRRNGRGKEREERGNTEAEVPDDTNIITLEVITYHFQSDLYSHSALQLLMFTLHRLPHLKTLLWQGHAIYLAFIGIS